MHCRPTRMLAVAVLLASVTTLVACGGGDDDGDSTPEQVMTSTAEPATTAPATEGARATRTPRTAPTSPTATISNTPETASPTAESVTDASPTPLGPTPTTPPVPTRAPPPPPATVNGSGTMLSTPVEFPEGIAVITMNHSGSGRFRVRLQSEELGVDRLVGEGGGIWKGSVGMVVRDPGPYVFSVMGDGDWQIDVMWPTPETAPVSETPFSASGTGDQAVYFVLVQTGSHTISMTHDGAGPFSVYSITHEGRRYIDRFSGVGPASASLEFTIRDKAFEFLLLNVRADGNWTIHLE